MGLGDTTLIFPRTSILERTPVSVGEREFSLVAGAEAPNHLGGVEISAEQLASADPEIQRMLGFEGSTDRRDEAYAVSAEDVNEAGDYGYPIEEAVMVVRSIATAGKLIDGLLASASEEVRSQFPQGLLETGASRWLVALCDLVAKGQELPEGSSETGTSLYSGILEVYEQVAQSTPDHDKQLDAQRAARTYAFETFLKNILVQVGKDEEWVDNNVMVTFNTIHDDHVKQKAIEVLSAGQDPGKLVYFGNAINRPRGFTQEDLEQQVDW